MRNFRTPVTLRVMGATADPTMDLIRSLDDASKWVVNTVVAFVPHQRSFPEVKFSDGTTRPAQQITVTETDLRWHATEANDRIRKTGRLDTLTIGHRNFDPQFPETKQPPLVGFARNYSVQWVEREGGRFLALVYDEYAARDKAAEHDLFRQYPFRSAEYHPQIGVNGVAALVRPPALDMGTVYIYQGEAMPDTTKTDAEQWTPEDEKTYAAFCKYMKKYTATMGPGNGALPGQPNPEPVPYQQNPAAPVKPVAPTVDPAVTALQAQVASLTRQRTEESAKRLLDPLTQIVSFDYARELTALVGYADDAQRAAHVQYMLQRYEKLPTGTVPFPVATQGANPAAYNPHDPMAEPPRFKEIVAYMKAHPGVQYDQAEAHVLSQK